MSLTKRNAQKWTFNESHLPQNNSKEGGLGKIAVSWLSKTHSNLVVHSGIEEINFIFAILTFLDIIV